MKELFEKLKCTSCGKALYFSKVKRILSAFVFIFATYVGNINANLTGNRLYSWIPFIGSLILEMYYFGP